MKLLVLVVLIFCGNLSNALGSYVAVAGDECSISEETELLRSLKWSFFDEPASLCASSDGMVQAVKHIEYCAYPEGEVCGGSDFVEPGEKFSSSCFSESLNERLENCGQ